MKLQVVTKDNAARLYRRAHKVPIINHVSTSEEPEHTTVSLIIMNTLATLNWLVFGYFMMNFLYQMIVG